MIYFHSFRNPGLIVDIVQDIRALNELSRTSKKAGMIILGGGVCKHQIANAMLIVSNLSIYRHEFQVLIYQQRNGADYSVYIVRLYVTRLPLSELSLPFRTLVKSLMAPIRVPVQTKQYPGGKSVPAQIP